jgi:hypothetical protein
VASSTPSPFSSSVKETASRTTPASVASWLLMGPRAASEFLWAGDGTKTAAMAWVSKAPKNGSSARQPGRQRGRQRRARPVRA